jgi:hypothetical protein
MARRRGRDYIVSKVLVFEPSNFIVQKSQAIRDGGHFL